MKITRAYRTVDSETLEPKIVFEGELGLEMANISNKSDDEIALDLGHQLMKGVMENLDWKNK